MNHNDARPATAAGDLAPVLDPEIVEAAMHEARRLRAEHTASMIVAGAASLRRALARAADALSLPGPGARAS